ncbi:MULTISPECIES: hypothetical protein [unclassified Acidiphilium]|uniref:hypothetical protein n=1 Tax=unclassified Acidiphilium TaxID=2617493 RepID=UPI00257ACE65|nr:MULTISPECIES: hypothetical protein [unclassified Acidiphilium]HQT82514.1 hypothetical protein [Ferrovaceae bacterium]
MYCNKVLEEPKKRAGIGAPYLNIHLYCECKSLESSNILFSEGHIADSYWNRIRTFWIGHQENLRSVVRLLEKQISLENSKKLKALYEYTVDRAFNQSKISLCATIAQPPVDFIATAFRETKNGKLDENKLPDQRQSSPIWNAIRSLLSAVEAGVSRSKEVSLDWICNADSEFYSVDRILENAAFFGCIS